jgi:hypothetical protein
MGPFGYPKKPKNGCGSQASTPQNEYFRCVQEGFKAPQKKAAGIALGKLQYMMLACLPSGYQTWLASKS